MTVKERGRIISPVNAFQADINTHFFNLEIPRDGKSRSAMISSKFKTIFVERCDAEAYIYFAPGDVTKRMDLREFKRIIFPRVCEAFWIENEAIPNVPNPTGLILQTSMDAEIETGVLRTTPDDSVTVGNIAVGLTSVNLPSYPCSWFTLFNLDKQDSCYYAVDRAATINDPVVAPESHLDIFVDDTGRVSVIFEGTGGVVAMSIHR